MPGGQRCLHCSVGLVQQPVFVSYGEGVACIRENKKARSGKQVGHFTPFKGLPSTRSVANADLARPTMYYVCSRAFLRSASRIAKRACIWVEQQLGTWPLCYRTTVATRVSRPVDCGLRAAGVGSVVVLREATLGV